MLFLWFWSWEPPPAHSQNHESATASVHLFWFWSPPPPPHPFPKPWGCLTFYNFPGLQTMKIYWNSLHFFWFWSQPTPNAQFGNFEHILISTHFLWFWSQPTPPGQLAKPWKRMNFLAFLLILELAPASAHFKSTENAQARSHRLTCANLCGAILW